MLCEHDSLSVKWMRPTQSWCHQAKPAGGGPSSSPPCHCLYKTLHNLISASPWLPRHLEVIIQQSTPQSAVSIMKYHIFHQHPAFCSCFMFVPTCCVCPTSNPVAPFKCLSFCSWFLSILMLFDLMEIKEEKPFV